MILTSFWTAITDKHRQ